VVDTQGGFEGIVGSKAVENEATRKTASEDRNCEMGNGAQHKGGGINRLVSRPREQHDGAVSQGMHLVASGRRLLLHRACL